MGRRLAPNKFRTDPIRGIEIEAHVPAQSTHSPS
jgi:hypothetical protein